MLEVEVNNMKKNQKYLIYKMDNQAFNKAGFITDPRCKN